MPHVIIELSRNVANRIDISDTLDSVHKGLCNTGILPVGAIKTRAIVHDHFAVGTNNTRSGFMTAVIRIQPGRSLENEQAVGRIVFETLSRMAGSIDELSVSVSVDVQHIYREALFSMVSN